MLDAGLGRRRDRRLVLAEADAGRKRIRADQQEMIDADKNPVLRSYLKRWKAEVGVFFDGVDAGSSDSELQAIAAKHPVFRLVPADQ